MEKHRQEESGLFAAPFAVSLSPVLFSEEEDSEYDFLNPADRQENTIVLFKNDRSAVHCMSSEDSPSPTPTYVYKPGDRSHSPSCTESEEETELSYNSPTLLLEISSSSSSTSVPEESHFTDNYKEQVLAFGAWIKSSSDSSSDCECNNCNPQSIRESKYDENIPSVRMSPHDQEAIDNSIYKYNTFSMEMIQAAHSLKYPAEVNKWAAEYLNHQGIKISSTEEMSVTS